MSWLFIVEQVKKIFLEGEISVGIYSDEHIISRLEVLKQDMILKGDLQELGLMCMEWNITTIEFLTLDIFRIYIYIILYARNQEDENILNDITYIMSLEDNILKDFREHYLYFYKKYDYAFGKVPFYKNIVMKADILGNKYVKSKDKNKESLISHEELHLRIIKKLLCY